MKKRTYLFVSCFLVMAGCQRATENISTAGFRPDGPKSDKPSTSTPDRPDPIDLTAAGAVGRGITIPTIIDTSKFARQIDRVEPWQGGQQSASTFRPAHPDLPALPHGPDNELRPGKLAGLNRVQTLAQFPGITRSPWNPPDPSIGVGPNHIIETVNMELAFFGKDGTLQFQQRLDSSGSPGFFEELGSGDFCYDPKCFYDHYANRFVVLALEVYRDIDEAWITIAISDDDNPHGVWYKYRTWAVVNVDDDIFWVDYPGLGYDANGYYITGNLFNFSFPSFAGVLIRSFDKTPMLTGQPVRFADILDRTSNSVQVAQHFGNNPAPWIASRFSNSSLKISAINDPFGNPSLTTNLISVPTYTEPSLAPNRDGGSVSTVGSRLMNVHWRDGKLWTCHAVESSDGNRVVARWYEIDTGETLESTTPRLAGSGEVDLGDNQFTFFPAIYSNENGNVAMVFAKSSPTEYVSVAATGRLATDPPGEMGNSARLIIGDTTALGRWGDYFDIALDPADGRTFWTVGEYMSSEGWRTSINSITLAESLDVVGDTVTVTQGKILAGTVVDLQASDDHRFSVTRSPSDIQAQTEFELIGNCPYANPAAMEITLEGAVLSRSAVIQTVELFNYDIDNWEPIDTRDAPRIEDSVTTLSPNGDVSRFVQPGTGLIEARLRFQSVVARQQFSSNTDQFLWTISP